MNHRLQVKKQTTRVATIILQKSKAANMMKSAIEDSNTEEEEASIMTDFDYHDTTNAERYEKH